MKLYTTMTMLRFRREHDDVLEEDGRPVLRAAEAFEHFPIALLESIE